MENDNLVKELVPIKAEVSKVVLSAENLKIKTAEDMVTATDILNKIQNIGRTITEKKEGWTKPLNATLKSIREFFNPFEAQWTEAEKIVKKKMTDYYEELRIKSVEKVEVIEKKVESGKMSFEKAAEKIEEITPQKSIEGKTGAVQFKTIKEVVVEDEKKVPREYLVLDMVKIRKVALAGVEIAGVKVVEKQIVAGKRY